MLQRRKADLFVLAAYSAISFAYVGWRMLPHPGRSLIGGGSTRDPVLFVWSFAWWPHAIANWMNPFVTHVVYVPSGINLTWATAVPGLALMFSPVTLLFGPSVAYNVAAMLLPALAAWTAYLLCRHLTGSLWASLVGGYLFGFSSTLLLQEIWGDLHMTGVFLLPLIALAIVRYTQAELDGRGLAWRLGLLVAGQLLISTEIALTATLMLALGLLLAFWLIPSARPRLRSARAPIGAGYLFAGLLASPFLVYAVLGLPSSGFAQATFGSDVLNFVVPPTFTAIGGSSFASVSDRFVGIDGYLGLPTLLIAGVFAFRERRSGVTRFLVAGFLICVLISLGKTLFVGGRELFPLPWRLVSHVPVLEDVFPFRFAAFVSLAAAAIVALWTATSKGWLYPRPFLLPVLAVAALVPAVWQSSFRTLVLWHPQRVAFFTDSAYKSCIPRNETVAIFPFGRKGNSLLYQAEASFWFRMASDDLSQLPSPGREAWTSFDNDWVVTELNTSDSGVPTMDSLLAFAAIHHVDRVVSLVSGGYPSAAQMRSFGPVQRVGGVLISPGCGQPPLAKRNLTTIVQTYLRQRQSQANIDYCLGPNTASLPQGLIPAGPLQGATLARYIAGQGLTCAQPPAGYKHRGFATPDLSVPPDTYPLYTP